MKKVLALLMVLTLAISMVAVTAAAEAAPINITVWCAENLVSLTEAQLAAYNETYGANLTFTIQPVGEGEAATNLITDVEAGADIYCFAQDQLARLVQAGALMPVAESLLEGVTARNDGGSVGAATVDGTVYAFPLTSDNGYFAYYDASKLTEEDFADQTTLIEAVKAAGGTIAFELPNSAWYGSSYFFATGCVSDWTANESGAFVDRKDTFNSEAGLIAIRGMAELVNSGVMVNSSSADALSNGSIVLVDGTWDYDSAKAILGDNLGCRELWSFTVDGESYHLGSFSGNKLIGVKPQADAVKGLWCQSVADYLTNEECQKARFEAVSWGPSNMNAQASEAVQANPALAALAAQNNYATAQGQFPNAWWDAGKAIAASLFELGNPAPSTEELQTILDTYEANLNEILAIESASVDGWTVVGDLNNASWDITCTENVISDGYIGTFEFDIEIAEVDWDAGFRLVRYNNWDAGDYHPNGIGYSNLTSTEGFAEGGDNNILLSAGSYHVVLVVTEDTAELTVTAI